MVLLLTLKLSLKYIPPLNKGVAKASPGTDYCKVIHFNEISCKKRGKCEGLFAASVFDLMKSYMYNVDAGYYAVYIITGISAPADEFYLLEKTLAESLSSFQFNEEYIR